MKTCLFLLMMGFVHAVRGQNLPLENVSPDDSACIRRSMAIIYQIKNSGQKPVYHLDNEIFAALFITDTVSRKQKLRILNLGEDKAFSFSLKAIHVNSYDSTGSMAFLKMEQEVPLMKEVPIAHCQSIGMDMSGFGLPGSVRAEILYAKVSISWPGKDLLIELGEPQK